MARHGGSSQAARDRDGVRSERDCPSKGSRVLVRRSHLRGGEYRRGSREKSLGMLCAVCSSKILFRLSSRAHVAHRHCSVRVCPRERKCFEKRSNCSNVGYRSKSKFVLRASGPTDEVHSLAQEKFHIAPRSMHLFAVSLLSKGAQRAFLSYIMLL